MACYDRVRHTFSEGRLESLVAARLAPGADKVAIDQRIWDLFGERWAVMFTDLSGFSRRVAEFGIVHFLQVIYESERLLVPVIEDHDGILLKVEGDSMLVVFRRPAKAVACAFAMQTLLEGYNRGKDPSEQVLLCVGVGYGDVLRIGDHDVFGAQVNAASKLGEDAAKAGEILVTDAVEEELRRTKGLRFVPVDAKPPGAKAAFRVEAARATARRGARGRARP